MTLTPDPDRNGGRPGRRSARSSHQDPRLRAAAPGRGLGASVTVSSRTRRSSSTALVTGINNGALYALIALGYTLVYGIIELINFAHGDLFMLATISRPS